MRSLRLLLIVPVAMCVILGSACLLSGCGGDSTPQGSIPSVKEAPPLTPEQKKEMQKSYPGMK